MSLSRKGSFSAGASLDEEIDPLANPDRGFQRGEQLKVAVGWIVAGRPRAAAFIWRIVRCLTGQDANFPSVTVAIAPQRETHIAQKQGMRSLLWSAMGPLIPVCGTSREAGLPEKTAGSHPDHCLKAEECPV